MDFGLGGIGLATVGPSRSTGVEIIFPIAPPDADDAIAQSRGDKPLSRDFELEETIANAGLLGRVVEREQCPRLGFRRPDGVRLYGR